MMESKKGPADQRKAAAEILYRLKKRLSAAAQNTWLNQPSKVPLQMRKVVSKMTELLSECAEEAETFFDGVLTAINGRDMKEQTVTDLVTAVSRDKEKVKNYSTALMATKTDIVLPEYNPGIDKPPAAKDWADLFTWTKHNSYDPDTKDYPILGPEPHHVIDNFEQAAVAAVQVHRDRCTPEGRLELIQLGIQHFEIDVEYDEVIAVGHMVAGPKFSFPDPTADFKKLSVKLMVKIRLVDEDAEVLKQREYWVPIEKVAEHREGMLLLDQYMALSGQFAHYADYGPDSGGAKDSLEDRPLFIPPEGYERVIEDYIYVDAPEAEPKTVTT